MTNDSLNNFSLCLTSTSNLGEIITQISDGNTCCVSIKNMQSHYQYANQNFIQLMGLSSLQQIMNKTDQMLYTDKSLIRTYKEHDQYVLEEAKILEVNECVAPKFNQPIIKQMQGKIYPIYENSSRPTLILGLFTPVSKLLKLDWDTVFKLRCSELNQILVRKKYPISLEWGQVVLSKKEVQLLVALLKGMHAGEIAVNLKLKQTTVESYLVNLKNKFGVNMKSELINLIISKNILQQILI